MPQTTLRKGITHRRKDAKDARDKRIFSKWLACWTQDEIGDSEGMDHSQISRILCEFPILENITKSHQTLATYSEPDWTPPIYNVWK